MTHSQALASGTRLKGGKYSIDEKISAGGFGITYKAHYRTTLHGELGDFEANVTVALKEFFYADACDRHPDGLTVLTTTSSKAALVETLRKRFLKEAQTLAGLRHPNIVRVLEIFEENGTAYMAMEFVNGGDLLAKVRGGVQVAEGLAVARQLLEALAYVHAQKVLHLDIKPANILYTPQGKAVLIDFGFAKHYNSEGHAQSTVLLAKSVGYTPLEQYAASNLAQFAPTMDIYALGATLYHCLTGRVPVEALLRAAHDLPAPHLLNAQVPQALSAVVMKAMAEKPQDRYQSAADMLAALPQTSQEHTQVELAPSADNMAYTVAMAKADAFIEAQLLDKAIEQYQLALKAKPGDAAAQQKLLQLQAPSKPTITPPRTYTETANGVSFTMVHVEGGSFQMGDPFGEGSRDEQPVHEVNLDGYYMGETVVTQALWRAVMNRNPSRFQNCDSCPVETVSWNDAQKFISKLNQLTGKCYRLPTEAEWEYAARERGRKVRFGNGQDILRPSEANFNASSAYKTNYSEVGEYWGKT